MPDKRKILSDLKSKLQKNFDNSVKDVVLFGSQASKHSTSDSDYDVLVVLYKDYSVKDELRIMDICYEIDLKYDIIIDVHVLSLKELQTLRGKQPIFVNALENGIYA